MSAHLDYIRRKRKEEIEREEDKHPSSSDAEKPVDENHEPDPVLQKETDLDNQEGAQEGTQEGENPQERFEEPESDEDWQYRFKRISGKVSQLEKDKNAAAKEAKEAKERYEALMKEHEELKASVHSKEAEQGVTERLEQALGEDWEYLDDVQRRALVAVASQRSDDDLDSKVDAAFKEREMKAQHEQFLERMNRVASDLGESSFISVINEPGFAEFLKEKRSRSAVFNDAANHKDAQAEADLRALLSEYLRKDSKGGTTPKLRVSKSEETGTKKETVSFDDYRQAVRDKRFPHLRKRANEIIAAYHKERAP